jgi:16S rRNA (cytosine967-C5)-methyltransferase
VSAKPGVDDARLVALRTLVGVERGARSDRLLDRELRSSVLAERDRRLATEIVYGALRRQAELDDTIRPYCDRPIEQLDDRVRAALRVGVYQVRQLDSIPAHAAVDQTVAAVKRAGSRGGGLVNGVLRAWLRAGAPAASHDEDAGRWQVPQWMAQRWARSYGREAAGRWLTAALEPAVTAVAVHGGPDRVPEVADELAAAGARVGPSPWHPTALRVSAAPATFGDWIAAGRITPRSEASQLVTALLPANEGAVLDACAGRGGKSLQLLGEGQCDAVIALDLHAGRLRDARAAATRIGVRGLHPVVADGARALPLRRSFARILVDAPCSGLGTIRRHPEIRWRVRPRRLGELAALQKRILGAAFDLLQPGGQLLYVTCSTEPEENEHVVAAVRTERPECETVELPRSGAAGHLIGRDGALRTYPTEPELDGFFAAMITRR